MTGHGHQHAEDEAADMFEPPSWEERYAGEEKVWSGEPNPQLVAEVSALTPGTALDVGCGEGGDVIWLAQQGWRVTGADFSANGLARAARHAEEAGVADRTDWWQVDARTFDGRTAAPSTWSPPTSCTRRTAGWSRWSAGWPRPSRPAGTCWSWATRRRRCSPTSTRATATRCSSPRTCCPGCPRASRSLVVEQRPRTVVRDGVTVDIDDSTLLARRTLEQGADRGGHGHGDEDREDDGPAAPQQDSAGRHADRVGADLEALPVREQRT